MTVVADQPEIFELDIDLDLINHLAHKESVYKLLQEQVRPVLVKDPLAKEVFEWQMQHVRDYGEPATASVLEDEFPDIAMETAECAIGDLILRLRTRYLKNEGRRHIREISDIAVNEPLEVAKEMQRRARDLVDITHQRGEVFGTGDWVRAKDAYDKAKLRGIFQFGNRGQRLVRVATSVVTDSKCLINRGQCAHCLFKHALVVRHFCSPFPPAA